MAKKLKLTFYGGAKTVTGSNFMLEDDKTKILVDCGLFQGKNFCEDRSCLEFPYDPSEVDILLVTHAHADHIGRIPKLVKEGFKGKIYSTLETMEISEIMLNDALKFVLREAQDGEREPIYEKEDVNHTFSLWQSVPYHEDVVLTGGFSAYFRDAGHILGSAIIEVSYNGEKIAFTGDLGNSPAPFLKDTENVQDAKYLLMESVYGDRNHEDVELRKEKLKSVVLKTVQRGGTLLIPAFSVSRTQAMLYELNDLIENNKMPSIPVFLDSPLAIEVTGVYRRRQENFKKETKDLIKSGDRVFDFPNLKLTSTREESEAIKNIQGPKVIIAGAGMSNGGRILHHEKRYLPDTKNTLLFVGYQAPGSLGRIIQDGTKEVLINDQKVVVRAELQTITGYSGHKGSDELLEFVESANEKAKLQKVFVAMGEPKSSLFLVQKIKDNLGIEAVSPEEGEQFELEF